MFERLWKQSILNAYPLGDDSMSSSPGGFNHPKYRIFLGPQFAFTMHISLSHCSSLN